MVQDRVQWRAFVNKELNSEVPLKTEYYLISSKKAHCSFKFTGVSKCPNQQEHCRPGLQNWGHSSEIALIFDDVTVKTDFNLVTILTLQNNSILDICNLRQKPTQEKCTPAKYKPEAPHSKSYTCKLSCHLRRVRSLAWYQSIDFQTSYFHLLSNTVSGEGPPYIRVYYLMQSYTLLLLSLFTLSTPKTPRVPALPSQCL
jgi:hypothetical protein